MANTKADLLQAIADESRRPLASYRTKIEQCVTDAIAQCETDTYWFNDTQGLTFTTVADQSAYGFDDLSTIASLTEIHNVSVTIGSGDVRDLTKSDWQDFENLVAMGITTGQPTNYAYRFKKLHLYPTPSDAWTVTIDAAYALGELDDDADANCWTVVKEGGLLIRYRAAALFYGTHLRLADRAASFENLAAREMSRLTASTSRRQATGRIRPSL
jgi:hypothetical protein